MLFNSHVFILVFLPVVLAGYMVLIRAKQRSLVIFWLVGASLAFYTYWEPRNLLVLIASIVFNYALGVTIGRRRRGSEPVRAVLVLGIAANLALLGFFKYAAFFAENLDAVLGVGLSVPRFALPLAISFFTFQQIAYLVDSARGETEDYDFARYCLFVTFFPQLIAGPIVNHKDMMPQYKAKTAFRPDAYLISLGVGMFVIGLSKKVLLADRIAPQSDAVFDAAAAGATIGFSDAWLGAVAYTLQLYFDFSGYSDMAIGLALLFGIRLPLNFNSPYKATSIVDFWRRWHMTLSFFLRRYLYVALGGNRRGPVRRHANLMITMLLGGLWHGAGWTFVVWGGLHGAALIVCHAWGALRGPRSPVAGGVAGALGWSLTLLLVICGWVLFRAASLPVASDMLSAMAGLRGLDLAPEYFGATGFVKLGLLCAIALFAPNSQEWLGYRPKGAPIGPVWTRRLASSPLHAAGLACVFMFALTQLSTVNVFLYFRF